MTDSKVISFLSAEWQRAGILPGDTVLIHSSLKRTLSRITDFGAPASPELVLRSFRDAVGTHGTLLLPLFNFDFTKGIPFDFSNTPSQMGALTECARKAPGAVRTGHPIYSFAALGANATRFSGVENFSGYGPDSPFAILRELNGKIAILDLSDQNSMTFYHHVEEMNNVPYRFHKSFEGDYIDSEGKIKNRTFGLFVRRLEQGIETDVDRMGELLWEKRLYSGERPSFGCGLRTIPARVLFDTVSDIIRKGLSEDYLFSVKKKAASGSDIKVGNCYEEVIELNQKIVADFAKLTGDTNRVHFDILSAQEAGFDRTIVHGMCAASFFSYILGTKFPGHGSIYLGQDIKFVAPIYVGETVSYRFQVKSKKPNKPIFVISTEVIGQDGGIRITGEAVIKIKS